MSKKARFLRLPAPHRGGKEPWTLVQIDPSRLNVQHIFELYEHEDGRYRRSNDDELVSRDIDASDLIAVLHDQLSQLKVLVAQQADKDDANKIIAGVVTPLDEIEAVFTSLAKGHVGHAADGMTALMSTLMGGLSELAAHIVTLRKITDGMSASAEHFEEKAADLEKERRDALIAELREWALAAEAVFGTVSELRAIEAKVRPLVEQFEHERTDGLDLFRDTNPKLVDAIKFLDLEFTSKAIVFVAHPDDSQAVDMLELSVNAGDVISEWRSAEDSQRAAREAQRGMYDREIAPLSEQILVLCQRLAQERKTLRECIVQQSSQANPQLPWQVQARGQPLISQDRYEAAMAFINDPDWYPDSVRNRLQGQVSRVGTLIRQPPKLSDHADGIFTAAKRYVDEVTEILDGMTSHASAEEDEAENGACLVKPVVPAPAEAEQGMDRAPAATPPPPAVVSTPVGEAPVAMNPDAEVVVSLDTERLTELTELLIAVGYARTCNSNPWASSSIKAMLRLLPHLGKATWDEVDAAIDPILTAIDAMPAVGDIPLLETVAKSAKISDRWDNSRSQWIRFIRQGTSYRYKLTKSMEAKGSAYLVKHGLSVDVIKSLDETRRAEEKKAYNEKKAADEAEQG